MCNIFMQKCSSKRTSLNHWRIWSPVIKLFTRCLQQVKRQKTIAQKRTKDSMRRFRSHFYTVSLISSMLANIFSHKALLSGIKRPGKICTVRWMRQDPILHGYHESAGSYQHSVRSGCITTRLGLLHLFFLWKLYIIIVKNVSSDVDSAPLYGYSFF